MVQDMKVNGRTTKLMAKELFGMFMEISMWETGLMIKHKDLGYILTLMVLVTLVSGRMTFSMAMELKNGLMGLTTKATISKVESKAKGLIYGLMDHSTMEIGLRIKFMAKANING